MVQRAQHREPGLSAGSQSPVRRDHLADQDLNARFHLEYLAARGYFCENHLPLARDASSNHRLPVRTEFQVSHPDLWIERPRLPSIRPISPFMSISVKCSRDGVLIRWVKAEHIGEASQVQIAMPRQAEHDDLLLPGS